MKKRLGCNRFIQDKRLSDLALIYTDGYDVKYLDTNGMFYDFFIDTVLYKSLINEGDKSVGDYPIFSRQWKGKYEIYNDTLHFKAINYRPIANTWRGIEDWFKIISRDTIELVAFRWLIHDNQNLPNNYYPKIIKVEPPRSYIARALPIEVKEKQKWLMKKKWFWCDKEQYKLWKKEMKKKE
ncbi:MAG: hypothetical protein A2X08_11470 [Bacteroidetes bacterium GWA2_32_17]|nr:MAG: hypothetical protein A2X08_11470 [Bacteroidetes bacterium GWA2_32_17]